MSKVGAVLERPCWPYVERRRGETGQEECRR